MFLEGLNKHHVRNTSLFSEIFSLSVDFLSSVVDPNKIFLGYLNFIFNVFSVGSGVITSGFVGISNR
jgi:hypothetical protein